MAIVPRERGLRWEHRRSYFIGIHSDRYVGDCCSGRLHQSLWQQFTWPRKSWRWCFLCNQYSHPWQQRMHCKLQLLNHRQMIDFSCVVLVLVHCRLAAHCSLWDHAEESFCTASLRGATAVATAHARVCSPKSTVIRAGSVAAIARLKFDVISQCTWCMPQINDWNWSGIYSKEIFIKMTLEVPFLCVFSWELWVAFDRLADNVN